MKEPISEIGIDADNRLYIKPSKAEFPLIYREAMEVHWDSDNKRLYGAVPRNWSYAQWFKQITDAAGEQGRTLEIGPATVWTNISEELRAEIEAGS